MKYGVVFPELDIHLLPELAQETEAAGWDGIFIWDGIFGLDPWIELAVMALHTQRVRLGTMLTPLSRRRPWKLAQETVTLDRLSHGRAILPVGLGAPGMIFGQVGEVTDRKTRAQLLDEGLAVLTGLWSGRPFSFAGTHYHLQDVTFTPTPIQQPRIPIWVVGAWPRPRSMQRVLRWDGLLTATMNDAGALAPVQPADIAAMRAYIEEHRTATTPFDIIVEGNTPTDDPARAAAIVRRYAAAGATWWLDNVCDIYWTPAGLEGMRARVRQGPPRHD